MSTHPWVVVEPPDSRGLRKITVDGKTVGSAWSSHELRKILSHLGYPKDMDLAESSSIHWRGGDNTTWPARPWRRRGTMVLMFTGMLVSCALLIFVGWPDALRALTFTQRIVGTIFILAGLLQVVAAFAVLDYWGRRHWSPAGGIILLGTLITFSSNATLIFMWFEETEYTPFLMVFIPLGLWSVWALCLLIREKAWLGMPQPKKFAVGVAFTALLTAVSLVYSTMYQPTAAPIHFILKAKFGTPQESPDLEYVTIPLKLYVKNDGAIPVYIVNNDYTVWGAPITHMADSDGVRQWKKATEEIGDAAEADRFAREGKVDVISSGHFYDVGAPLDAGEEINSEEIIRLPKDTRYGELEATLEVEYMRRDRGRLDQAFDVPVGFSWDRSQKQYYCSPDACGEYVIYNARVRHNNNMINVTRRPRNLTAFWGPITGFDAFISSFEFTKKTLTVYQDGIDEEEIKRERDSYGLEYVYTNSVIPASEWMRLSVD